jgi:hypothetical protein
MVSDAAMLLRGFGMAGDVLASSSMRFSHCYCCCVAAVAVALLLQALRRLVPIWLRGLKASTARRRWSCFICCLLCWYCCVDAAFLVFVELLQALWRLVLLNWLR